MAVRVVKKIKLILKNKVTCNIVVINKGEKEITTPREFLDHFKFMPDIEVYHSITIDEYLCNCDIEEAFKLNNIEFKKYWGDFYVGMLEDVECDDDY